MPANSSIAAASGLGMVSACFSPRSVCARDTDVRTDSPCDLSCAIRKSSRSMSGRNWASRAWISSGGADGSSRVAAIAVGLRDILFQPDFLAFDELFIFRRGFLAEALHFLAGVDRLRGVDTDIAETLPAL